MEVRRLTMGLVGTTGGLDIPKDNDKNDNIKNNQGPSSQLQNCQSQIQIIRQPSCRKIRIYFQRVTLTNIPKLWPALEFALSVKSILNIKNCNLPFAGILLGPGGRLIKDSKYRSYLEAPIILSIPITLAQKRLFLITLP